MAEKILLVDDDADTLRLVGLMLQRQGYEVRVASSGEQALTMIQSEMPDLVLLDIMMPEMDGYEVARRLRSEAETADIPIIMFTAKSQVDDKVLGFESGADDYLTKPTQPRELYAHIKAVLSRTGKSRTPSAPTSNQPGYMIGVLSAKGGLGVSTIALNLGIALHENHKKEVIVSDFRPGQGTIGLELGLGKTEGVNHLLLKQASDITFYDVEAELIDQAMGIRLLLSSSNPADGRYANAVAHFEVITKHLALLSSYIVVDLGASINPITDKVLRYFDELIIIIEPVPHTIQQTKSFLSDIYKNFASEKNVSIVLVNRFRSGVHLSWSQVQEQLERSISVIFTPAPELAYQASLIHIPMVKYQDDSLSKEQFGKLADNVIKHSQ